MNNPTDEQTIFEKNIGALLLKNSLLATKLFAITENQNFEVFQGEDPLNINILDKLNGHILYDKPIEDTLNQVDQMKDKERYPYRYFFGIGNGLLIKMLLRSAYIKRIVIIEPNLEILFIVLNLLNFSEEIEKGSLELDTVEDLDFVRALHYVGQDESKIYVKLFALEPILPYYEIIYENKLLQSNKQFISAIDHNVKSHGNDVIDSLMGIEHHCKNLPLMIKNPKIQDLIKQKNADTAIVISTGPSLVKQLPLLKKIQNHALLISVDASFPILEKHGIKPDIVTVLERIPETANFFKNNSPDFQKEVIFVLASLVHEDIINAIRTGHKVLTMRPHGLNYYFGLDEFGYLGMGMSAANLAHELAIAMQVKQCILIGQDLSFSDDGKSHASGHFFGEHEENHEVYSIFVDKYGGEGKIKTTYYWVLFKEFFEKTIENTKNFVTTINCTEGGARIQNALELPFEDAVKTYLDISTIKNKIIPIYPTEAETKEYSIKVQKKTKVLLDVAYQKQKNVETVFLKLKKATEKLEKLKNEKKLDEINFQNLVQLTEEIDVIKAYLDDNDFMQKFYDTLRSSIMHQELDLVKLQVKIASTDDEKKVKLLEWIFAHIPWLFILAGSLNAQREVIVRAILTWPEDLQNTLNITDQISKLQESGTEISEEKKESFRMRQLQADGSYK